MTAAATQRIITRLQLLPDDRENAIMEFIATLEDEPISPRKNLDLDAFCVPTERGKHVDEYMEEIRTIL